MPEPTKPIEAAVLADALLDYAFRPPGPELAEFATAQGASIPHFLDEALILKIFSVDYVLGIRSWQDAGFEPVRAYFNAALRSRCAFCEVDEATLCARFETYTRAVNLDSTRKRDGRGPHWELAKAFCRNASAPETWRPNALQIAAHSYLFAESCLSLMNLIRAYTIL